MFTQKRVWCMKCRLIWTRAGGWSEEYKWQVVVGRIGSNNRPFRFAYKELYPVSYHSFLSGYITDIKDEEWVEIRSLQGTDPLECWSWLNVCQCYSHWQIQGGGAFRAAPPKTKVACLSPQKKIRSVGVNFLQLWMIFFTKYGRSVLIFYSCVWFFYRYECCQGRTQDFLKGVRIFFHV